MYIYIYVCWMSCHVMSFQVTHMYIPTETFLPLSSDVSIYDFFFVRMLLLSAQGGTLIINLVVVLLLIASFLEMMELPDLRLSCPRHTQMTYRWVSFFSLLPFMWVSSFLLHSFSFDYFFMWFLSLFLMFEYFLVLSLVPSFWTWPSPNPLHFSFYHLT